MSENILETVFLVVLYNKCISQSSTIFSLLKYQSYPENTKIILWNNGPKYVDVSKITHVNRVINIEVINRIENVSLSKIYNSVIDKYHSNKYVILDDDSAVTDEYISAVLSASNEHLTLPLITVNGNYRGLRINDKIVESTNVKTSLSDKVMSVGSGMCLGYLIIEKFRGNFESIFDERFVLYGVDTTFYLRFNQLGISDTLRVIKGFEHDFSVDSNDISEFRRKELSYDIGLQIRHYKPTYFSLISLCRSVIKQLRLSFSDRRRRNIIDLCKAYFFGTHYRNK